MARSGSDVSKVRTIQTIGLLGVIINDINLHEPLGLSQGWLQFGS